jgi:hypothetical protein
MLQHLNLSSNPERCSARELSAVSQLSVSFQYMSLRVWDVTRPVRQKALLFFYKAVTVVH